MNEYKKYVNDNTINIIMNNYKILCINLVRRHDRRESIVRKLADHDIHNCEFIEAIDGSQIKSNDESLNLFKHSVSGLLRRGVTGCAMSHYNVWKRIALDTNNCQYLVLEDDVIFGPDFKKGLEKILLASPNHGIVLIGMTLESNQRVLNSDIYEKDKSYTVHNLNRDLYCGGAFGYIISQPVAEQLVNYVEQNGIRMVIDYLMFRSGVPMYESHPHLVFTDAVQHSTHHVDSDIQHDYEKITYTKLSNNYLFDDYVFYPNLDSPRGDIKEVCADILMLKRIADETVDCIAFNTWGWLKHTVVNRENYIDLPNKYYENDGMYIKKTHTQRSLSEKINYLREINRPVKIFINDNAKQYAQHIVNTIINNFKCIEIVTNITADIIIDHITDSNSRCNNYSINILISGEPYNSRHKYDIAIDTKYNSNAHLVIHYPFLFSSLREHRKSINCRDYSTSKSKFCAYMYHMIHSHRIAYFNLVSSYKQVDALGRCCNNVDITNTRYEFTSDQTYNDISIQYYTEYKFVLAIENQMIPGYSTEKLINPMIANSIPIYWGDSEIFKYVNKNRVIYIPDFSNNHDLLNHIKYLDENPDAYEKVISEKIFVNDSINVDFMEKQLSEKIKNIFSE
ncbi:fucosyltransferase [Bandra megavirus]|uniref:Fucosyltransferase n=1 Tax=Bandra megavirus TaxID=2071566 RepID=A0A2K9V950_9VIRU|nr:fucosyltransferase [Bandra megavirus]